MRPTPSTWLARHRSLPRWLPDRHPRPRRRGQPAWDLAGHRTDTRILLGRRMAAMSPKKTYVAVYERDPEDDVWNVHIKGVDGCQTYGRSLRQAQARIREALGLWL